MGTRRSFFAALMGGGLVQGLPKADAMHCVSLEEATRGDVAFIVSFEQTIRTETMGRLTEACKKHLPGVKFLILSGARVERVAIKERG